MKNRNLFVDLFLAGALAFSVYGKGNVGKASMKTLKQAYLGIFLIG